MKISEIYGKKVISAAGKTGYVVSVNAYAGRLQCLVCADEDENEFKVDIKNIISYGNYIRYEDRESAIKAAKPIRLGSCGYDEDGNFLGELQEYTFTGDKLLKAKIGKKNYPAASVISGDAVIVKKLQTVKYDIVKDGEVLIKSGTPVSEDVLAEAEREGQYVQLRIKSL